MRDIPRDITDKKDVESWFRALRDNAIAVTSHKELSDVEEVDDSSTDSSKTKHVSNYNMKKISDHMDDASKHLNQQLTGGSNYLSTITATAPVAVSGSGTSRDINISAHVDGLDPHDVYQKESEKGAASGYASLNASSLVSENPANATATPTASKIPIADGSGKLDGWITAATAYTGGNNIVISGTDIHQALEFGASAYRAGFITVTTSTWTKITLDSLTASYLDNDFDPLTNNDYLAPIAGNYHVDILGGIVSLADGAEVRVAIYVNGTIVSYNNAYSPNAAASPRVLISKDLKLAANDHVEGYIWHDHGSNRNTITDAMYMTIHFIG